MARTAAKLAFAALVLTLNASAIASEGVLLEELPTAMDAATALSIARHALAKREWTVTASDATSIAAKINAQNIDSQIHIRVVGREIRYEEKTISLDALRHGQTPEIRIPARWINALRGDIYDQVQTRALNAPVSSPKLSPSERMAELRKMRDAGLITPDEYESKRANILRDL